MNIFKKYSLECITTTISLIAIWLITLCTFDVTITYSNDSGDEECHTYYGWPSILYSFIYGDKDAE